MQGRRSPKLTDFLWRKDQSDQFFSSSVVMASAIWLHPKSNTAAFHAAFFCPGPLCPSKARSRSKTTMPRQKTGTSVQFCGEGGIGCADPLSGGVRQNGCSLASRAFIFVFRFACEQVRRAAPNKNAPPWGRGHPFCLRRERVLNLTSNMIYFQCVVLVGWPGHRIFHLGI